ncbi:MAG: beta-glucuronidase [Anaerolineae bacterium]|nr:beta-glucuronidase [Anaerolineae bacterium]
MLYPQQNDRRNLLNLSGFWDFKLDPDEIGASDGWSMGLDAPRTIAVPGSWNEQFEDAYHYLGMAWYLRDDVYVPSAWQGQRVMLRVGSVNYYAQLWANGQIVGEHVGGHLPFAFDITDHIKWGEANTIAVQVENHLQPNRIPAGNLPSAGGLGGSPLGGGYPSATFDFYPFAGIHRPVILYSVPQAHIEDVTVVTEIEGTTGIVSVTAQQVGDIARGTISLVGDSVVATAELSFADGMAQARLQVPNANLWSMDSPYLYDLVITLQDGGLVVDRYSLEIGIRTIEVRGTQLLLNGEPVYLKGFGRHEDFYASGRGLNQPLIVKDYSLMKWVGANSYRTSHYPYSEEEMRMADREGMLIIDEIPAVSLNFFGSDDDVATRLAMCKQQLEELVARDKNHPSVIMWSVANEPFGGMIARMINPNIPENYNETGHNFLGQLIDLAHHLDATRPATLVGIMGGPAEWLDLADVILINRYYGWYMQTGRIHEGEKGLEQELDGLAEFNKPLIMSEFGADAMAGMHSIPAQVFTEDYQRDLIKMYLDVTAKHDFVIGMHIWNFADFQATQSISRVGGMNLKGVFTRARQPKMAAYLLRERWNSQGQ